MLTVVSALGVLAGAIRQAVNGFVPMSDDALFEIRAYDVFSRHHPLTGLYSTAGTVTDRVYHPGPILFELMAIPARLGPHGTGIVIGMGVLGAIVAAAIPWTASRFLGRDGAAVVAAVTGVFCWTFGPEVIINVFPAHASQLPFLLLLVSAWGWATGHDRLFVVVALSYTLAGQTHGSTFVVGSGLLIVAALLRVTRRRAMPLRWRPLAGGSVLLALLWAQPIAQQFFGDGPGNISQMLRGGPDGSGILGVAAATRVVASVLVVPPWWIRPGFLTQVPSGFGTAASDVGSWPTAPSILGLLAIAVALVIAARWMHRHGNDTALSGAVLVAAAAAWGVVFLSQVPMGVLGFMGHTGRWLWPVGAFLTMYALVGVARHIPAAQRTPVVSAVAGIGLVAGLAVPWTHSPDAGPGRVFRSFEDASIMIRESLNELEHRGTIYVDATGDSFDMWSDSILAEMTRRGIPYVIDEPYRLAQLGDDRRLDGDAEIRLWVSDDGDEVLPDNAEVLIEVHPPPLVHLSALEELLIGDLVEGPTIRVVIEPIEDVPPSSEAGARD